MITVGVAGIMAAVALPSYKTFVLNNRLSTQKNEFVLAMAYARSEAMKRGVRVSVCGRSTDTACVTNAVWDNGWLVFVDNNLPTGTVNGTDQVLQIRSPLRDAASPQNGNTLRAGGTLPGVALPSVTFQSNGFTSVGSNGSFVFSDSRGPSASLRVCVSLMGLVSTPKSSADQCLL